MNCWFHASVDVGIVMLWRWSDPNWIIILFLIHINSLWVEKVEESSHGIIFIGETQFGKTRSKTFEENFEASNDVFWGYKSVYLACTFSCYSTHKDIFNGKRITSSGIYVKVMPLSSWPSYFDHHGSWECRVNPHYSWKRG